MPFPHLARDAGKLRLVEAAPDRSCQRLFPIVVDDPVKRLGPNRTYATDLEFRHFEKVCEALGGHGEPVRETSEIHPALERSFASGKPAVINVVTGRVPSPGWNWFYRDIDPRTRPLGSG